MHGKGLKSLKDMVLCLILGFKYVYEKILIGGSCFVLARLQQSGSKLRIDGWFSWRSEGATTKGIPMLVKVHHVYE